MVNSYLRRYYSEVILAGWFILGLFLVLVKSVNEFVTKYF